MVKKCCWVCHLKWHPGYSSENTPLVRPDSLKQFLFMWFSSSHFCIAHKILDLSEDSVLSLHDRKT